MTHHRQQALIQRHFAGTNTPGREHAMREHLVACADCREHYERHLHLAAVDPGCALPRDERLARGLGLGPAAAESRASRRWLALAFSASVACALVLVVVVGGHRAPMSAARGTATPPRSQLLVYEVIRGQRSTVRQAASSIHADSALAFAYANMSHRRYLMVFAVDEDGRIYWYHPGWEKPADNPIAVAIEPDEAVHEIPQAVSHRFSGRRLQLWGVFMDRPMSVREMEAQVARRFDLAEADVTRWDLRLEGER